MTDKEIISFLKTVPHKAGVNKNDWDNVHPNLLTLARAYVGFCYFHGLIPLFTSIIRPMLPMSETNIHEEKRAFDGSVLGWTTDLMDEFMKDGNKTYKSIAAISRKDLVERAYYIHNGTALHLHGQVRA